MKKIRFLLFPFALIYGLITYIRNQLFEIGFFKASKFSLPVINIGNLNVGGTGKTPHTEYLIRQFLGKSNLFTLSRGYGRKEYGFIIANESSTARQIGDEPAQFQHKFGNDIGVAVDANRVNGIMEICRHYPDTDLILLDDAFQHRAVQPGLNILISAFNKPFYQDFLLPVGNLRELRSGKKRADIIVISKCPDFDSVDKQSIIQNIKPAEHQQVFLSRIKYGTAFSFDLKAGKSFKIRNHFEGENIILVTGIANANPLVEFLGKTNTIVKHFRFPDHYNFKEQNIREIHNLIDKFVSEKPIIVTTEKDAMRLVSQDWSDKLSDFDWNFQSIEIELDDESLFNQLINDYVEKNRRDY